MKVLNFNNLVSNIHSISSSLNKILQNYSLQNHEQEFHLFAPRMPLNFSPLHVLLEVKNTSLKIDKEVKISKKFQCECLTECKQQKRRIKSKKRKKNEQECKHLRSVEVRPKSLKVKADGVTHIETIFRYELVGCQEIVYKLR